MLPQRMLTSANRANLTPPDYEFLGMYTSGSVSSTSHTFSSINIGTPTSDRLIVVGSNVSRVAENSTGNTTVTVGGTTLTEYARVNYAAVNRRATELNGALITTGSTADIVVTMGFTMSFFTIAVWALRGLSSSTPHGTNQASAFNGSGISMSLSCPAGGTALFFAAVSTTDDDIAGWTNATEVSQIVSVAGGQTAGCAVIDPTSSSTPTITASQGAGGNSYHSMVGASFSR